MNTQATKGYIMGRGLCWGPYVQLKARERLAQWL